MVDSSVVVVGAGVDVVVVTGAEVAGGVVVTVLAFVGVGVSVVVDAGS